MTPKILELSRIVGSARRVVVVTGAGISAESGIPTYRGLGSGGWDGLEDSGRFSQRAAVKKDLIALWRWYDSRRRLVAACEPNAGHMAIAEMARRIPRFTLVTQNIDGLHQRAGNEQVLEVHGSLWRAKGVRCSHKQSLPAGPIETPPRCGMCGHPLRPDVVFFGEKLSQIVFKGALRASTTCEVMFVIGTSLEVAPVSSLPELAKANGARIIEINPSKTCFSLFADEVIRAPASALRWSG